MKNRHLSCLCLMLCLVFMSGCSKTVTLLLNQIDSEADSSSEMASGIDEPGMDSQDPVSAEAGSEQEERDRKILVAKKLKNRKYKKDLRVFNAAIRVDDQEHLPFIERAMCHWEFGNFNRAIKDCDKAIELADADIGDDGADVFAAYSLRAMSWVDAGNYDAAFDNLETSLELYPEGIAEVSLIRGVIYEAQGDYQNAAFEYEKGLELRSNNWLYWLHASRVLSKAPDASVRNGEYAVTAAIKAVQLSGDDLSKAKALDALGSSWAEMGDFEKALKSAKVAFDTAPDEAADILIAINDNIKLFEAGKPARLPVIESHQVAVQKHEAKQALATKKAQDKPVARRAAPSANNNNRPMKIIRTHYDPTKREAINN